MVIFNSVPYMYMYMYIHVLVRIHVMRIHQNLMLISYIKSYCTKMSCVLYSIDYGIFVTALIWGMSSGGLRGLKLLRSGI